MGKTRANWVFAWPHEGVEAEAQQNAGEHTRGNRDRDAADHSFEPAAEPRQRDQRRRDEKGADRPRPSTRRPRW
jgi:hypothetical protein